MDININNNINNNNNIVRICGTYSSDSCGYCKNKKTSCSYGLISNYITSQIYLDMMMRGWRRSGTYFYKPIMNLTCCPQYTIRLNANEFKISKSQNKVNKKFNNYLNGIYKANNLSHNLIISINDPTDYTPDVYQLYRDYQVNVHHDEEEDCKEDGFRRFLVDSPLYNINNNNNNNNNNIFNGPYTSDQDEYNQVPYGTYHIYFKIDDALIAVSVVDILPTGLSSVYCFYDINYNFLSVGKYTALKEIEYVQKRSFFNSEFIYYYMGYYIYNNSKMNYKGDYHPSELLCPETFEFYKLDEIKYKFENTLYSRLAPININNNNDNEFKESENIEKTNEDNDNLIPPDQRFDPNECWERFTDLHNLNEETIIRQVKIDIGIDQLLTIDFLQEKGQTIVRKYLHDYIPLIGPELSKEIVVGFN